MTSKNRIPSRKFLIYYKNTVYKKVIVPNMAIYQAEANYGRQNITADQ